MNHVNGPTPPHPDDMSWLKDSNITLLKLLFGGAHKSFKWNLLCMERGV